MHTKYTSSWEVIGNYNIKSKSKDSQKVARSEIRQRYRILHRCSIFLKGNCNDRELLYRMMLLHDARLTTKASTLVVIAFVTNNIRTKSRSLLD